MKRALVFAVALAGCTGRTDASKSGDEPATPSWNLPPAPVRPQDDRRDQYELVQEILAARGTHDSELVSALDAVRDSWEGHRYTWTVALSPVLCRADGCVVLPFDHGRNPQAVIVQGWLPEIELDEAQRGALLAACAAHRICVFTMEGTLRELTLTVDLPTSLAFHQVEFRDFRDAGDGESWIRRRQG